MYANRHMHGLYFTSQQNNSVHAAICIMEIMYEDGYM